MCHVVLVLPILLVASYQEPAHPSTSDQQIFDAARAGASSDPAKLAKLALWCEAHGMGTQERGALDEAVRLDPNNRAARGLLGHVSYQGRWDTPEAVCRRVKEDVTLGAKLAEYNTRRIRIDRDTEIERRSIANLEALGLYAKAAQAKLTLDRRIAPEHVRLGLWCEQNDLKAKAQAHFTTALLLNPHDQTTWRHLGYIKHRGRWTSHEQIAAEEHEALALKHADRHWEPLLRKWATEMRVPRRRAEAEANLAKVSDPRAVRTIVRLFGEASPASQKLATRLLEQIDAPPATRELAAFAVYSDDPDVRQAAANALKGRPPRDYAGEIVNRIHSPVTFQVQPLAGVGSQGSLVVDSLRFHVVRTYKAPMPFRLSSTFGGYAGYDANGMPMVLQRSDWRTLERDMDQGTAKGFRSASALIAAGETRASELIASANLNALAARERMAQDVSDLETFNAESHIFNQRASEVLTVALQAPPGYGDDEDAWRSWYYDLIGYRYTPPPKVMVAQNGTLDLPTPVIVSCFAAGTPIPTIEGPRAIELVRTGDQVLSRDVATGSLAFQTVLAVHHNPPDKTLRIALDNGDAVVASRFHRFWLAGRGWAMARELKSGDVVRTLGGRARITSVDQAPVQPVYNLDVAESRTYFVGTSAMLVHDNTLPPPHPDQLPFDRVEALAAKAP
jgi:hypothetical protein